MCWTGHQANVEGIILTASHWVDGGMCCTRRWHHGRCCIMQGGRVHATLTVIATSHTAADSANQSCHHQTVSLHHAVWGREPQICGCAVSWQNKCGPPTGQHATACWGAAPRDFTGRSRQQEAALLGNWPCGTQHPNQTQLPAESKAFRRGAISLQLHSPRLAPMPAVCGAGSWSHRGRCETFV